MKSPLCATSSTSSGTPLGDFCSGTSNGTTVVSDALRLGTTTRRSPTPTRSGRLDHDVRRRDLDLTGRDAGLRLHRARRLLERRHPARHVGPGVDARHGRRRHHVEGVRPRALGRETPTTIHRTSVPAQGDALATVAIDTLVARKGRSLPTWQLKRLAAPRPGSRRRRRCAWSARWRPRLPEEQEGARQSLSAGTGHRAGRADVLAGDPPRALPGVQQRWRGLVQPDVDGDDPRRTGAADPTAAARRRLSHADFDPPTRGSTYAAANTYDWNYDGAGNWPFNTAYAATVRAGGVRDPAALARPRRSSSSRPASRWSCRCRSSRPS